MKWTLLSSKKPPKNTELWVAFHYEKDAMWKGSKEERSVKLCQYTPNYIVPLCEEDDGSWKGLGSTDCEAAWAWALRDAVPKYPRNLEEKGAVDA